jgi:hypothetical protein
MSQRRFHWRVSKRVSFSRFEDRAIGRLFSLLFLRMGRRWSISNAPQDETGRDEQTELLPATENPGYGPVELVLSLDELRAFSRRWLSDKRWEYSRERTITTKKPNAVTE